MSEQPHNSEGYQHEALDRCWMFSEILDGQLTNETFIAGNPDLKAKADAMLKEREK